MNASSAAFSIRRTLERIFFGLASMAIVAFVALGTAAMCLPGAGAA
jgi:hypothetical protein